MASKKCPGCKRNVPAESQSCPVCGHIMAAEWMKPPPPAGTTLSADPGVSHKKGSCLGLLLLAGTALALVVVVAF